MNPRNPTPVTLGLNGTFAGISYRVAGRVVMGMEDAGETFYWQEFNLLGPDGKSATLVHEVTESGPQWRLFTLFDPRTPMSVEEAARQRIGNTVNLDGQPRRVTLVDESRVYHIEGQAPEGVEVGDVARYFNAESGAGMVVVSWMGGEIEFYHGLDLPRGAVTSAFGLPEEKRGFYVRPTPAAASSALPDMLRKFILPVFMAIIAAVIFWPGRSVGCRSSSTTQPAKPKLPAAPLSLGAEGNLLRTTWNIRGHAVTEIAQVGQIYDRHEYQLVDALGNKALLVFGTKPGATDWMLFTPFQPDAPLTPTRAAAQRLGDKLNLDGGPATITGFLRSTLRQTKTQDLAELTDDTILYGFTAQSPAGPILARWNATNLVCYRGQTLSAKEVKQAFGK